MNEIEKLYENAGIEYGSCQNYSSFEPCCNSPFCDSGMCPHGISGKKHPFTAEKQLKIIEFFISSVWWMNLKTLHKTLDCSLNFEDKLAIMVNYLWLSLTEEEKRQIKEILNG